MTNSPEKDKHMPSQKDISKLSPDKLMRRFRESKIIAAMLLALGLHVVVLGGTSVDYIHGLVDPAWKDEQNQLAEQARKAEANKTATKAKSNPSAATKPATTTNGNEKPNASQPATGKNNERKLPAELTTMPKPGEIPSAPGGGIGIDDMEKK